MADEQKPDEKSSAQPTDSPEVKPPAEALPKPPAAKPATPAKPAAPAAPKAPATMAAKPWESELTRALKQEFGDAISEFSTYLGQNFLVAKADAVPGIVDYLKTETGFDYLVDITAVDYPKNPERFELFYILYSFGRNERLRIRTRIALGQKPQSVVAIHPTANWLEREVFDMFGIEFAGHPDLKRILLPEDWEGYPLRKDSSITNMDNRWVKENLGIESGQ